MHGGIKGKKLPLGWEAYEPVSKSYTRYSTPVGTCTVKTGDLQQCCQQLGLEFQTITPTPYNDGENTEKLQAELCEKNDGTIIIQPDELQKSECARVFTRELDREVYCSYRKTDLQINPETGWCGQRIEASSQERLTYTVDVYTQFSKSIPESTICEFDDGTGATIMQSASLRPILFKDRACDFKSKNAEDCCNELQLTFVETINTETVTSSSNVLRIGGMIIVLAAILMLYGKKYGAKNTLIVIGLIGGIGLICLFVMYQTPNGFSEPSLTENANNVDAPNNNTALDTTDSPVTIRDEKRLADIRQIQSALELFYTRHGESSYPASSTPTDIQSLSLTPAYLSSAPTAPTPPDGTCTDTENSYKYKAYNRESMQDCDNTTLPCDWYTITFCLGDSIRNLSSGAHVASPSGIH